MARRRTAQVQMSQKRGCLGNFMHTWGRLALYWQIGRIIINAIREYNTKPSTGGIRRS